MECLATATVAPVDHVKGINNPLSCCKYATNAPSLPIDIIFLLSRYDVLCSDIYVFVKLGGRCAGWYSLGRALLEMKFTAEALEALSVALQLDPRYEAIVVMLKS